MSLNIMERPADIAQQQTLEAVGQTCRDWDAWSRGNVVDQVDAGI